MDTKYDLNTIDKRFDQFHHRLGRLRDCLFLDDLLDGTVLPSASWEEIRANCPDFDPYHIERCTEDQREKMRKLKGTPMEKPVRRFMEFERCFEDYGKGLEHLWKSALAVAEKTSSTQGALGERSISNVTDGDEKMEFDFLVETILDALGAEEKSRILAGCTILAHGQSPYCEDVERKTMDILMYIKLHLYPELKCCAKRFTQEVLNFISREPCQTTFDEHEKTCIFGHTSSTPTPMMADTSSEDAIRNFPLANEPDCFLDALCDWELDSLMDFCMCNVTSIRASLAKKKCGTAAMQTVIDAQLSYAEALERRRNLPRALIDLLHDFRLNPKKYADDLTCHERPDQELERNHPIIKLLPPRLRRRLNWGYEHPTAVERGDRLTAAETDLLKDTLTHASALEAVYKFSLPISDPSEY